MAERTVVSKPPKFATTQVVYVPPTKRTGAPVSVAPARYVPPTSR